MLIGAGERLLHEHENGSSSSATHLEVEQGKPAGEAAPAMHECEVNCHACHFLSPL